MVSIYYFRGSGQTLNRSHEFVGPSYLWLQTVYDRWKDLLTVELNYRPT